MKSKNIARLFKEKYPLFGAGGNATIINLFSNSLEHMGYFCGHKNPILFRCRISNIILASGSSDNNIKIWGDIEDNSLISTLSRHRDRASALCSVNNGVFVSGSYDNSLIIWCWCKSTPKSSI